MTTDLQQPLPRKITSGPLGNFVEFKNGRSSPDRSNSGTSAVYGSNGIIGRADVTNSPEGTLVVGRVGSYCGSVHYSPNKCWVTDNAIIGSSRSQKDSRFWFYKLASLDLNNYRAGSGQPLLNQQILNSIQVSIPAGEDDRFQIARVLAAFDDKIDVNRRINQTLEAMAQAIFKSWFVDFDPVKARIAAKQAGRDPLRAAMCTISGKIEAELDALPREQYTQLAATAALFPEEMEELEGIPRGWTPATLSTVCDINASSWSAKTLPASVKYVDLANTKNGEILEVQVMENSNIPSRARRVLNAGDTIVGTVRPGNRSFALVGEADLTGSTGFAVLHPKKDYFREYVYLAATSDVNIERLAHLADGGAYPAVRPELVISDTLPMPHGELLRDFHRVSSYMFDQILANRKANRDLAELRDTLLPKLLSGELPVTALIKNVDAA